jgi:hypothetical protein
MDLSGPDSGTQPPEFQVEARGLLHDVRSGEIVLAFLQILNERLCDFIAVYVVGVPITCRRVVFPHPLEKVAHSGVVFRLRADPAFGASIQNDSGRFS